MEDDMAEPKKIIVGADNTAVFSCPVCFDSKTVPLAKLIPAKYLQAIKCPCGSEVPVKLEFVKSDNTAVLNCPACRKSQSMPVAIFKPGKNPFKVKCSCGTIVPVQLEFRKHYRKMTNLVGHYQMQDGKMAAPRPDNVKPAAARQLYGADHGKPAVCKIASLSKKGLGLQTAGLHTVEEGHMLVVAFHLDNNAQTEIKKMVVVRSVSNRHIGCEFLDDSHAQLLGFYLL
ncbi:MAG: hypothetical protein A2521_13775 [Deltaproteobacteria bacterium RIFOXYD12_FULL_57_12]|nr:MAG: hypothetical protein A2521_13775 [Deltaproteobacteria bacterium RIFOXYD12_FULL_57_12]